jgi:PhnB protein
MAASVSTGKTVETTITTLLNVRRGAEALDFYSRAFSATILSRIDGDDGSVVAHLAVGKGDFWVADESLPHRNFSPESLGGSSVRMVLIVDDPHAAFDQAVAAGASSVCPVRDESYGWRIGRVADPFGHHWEIGKKLAEG